MHEISGAACLPSRGLMANERNFRKLETMVGKVFSSGDPSVDRRGSYAETLAYLGDMAGAVEVLAGALELAPDWAAGWFKLGEYYEAVGETEEALKAWDRAIAADPTDVMGAGLKRGLVTATVVETMPTAFVEMLFDQYAQRFENSLVEKLGYRGPKILTDLLRQNGFEWADRTLDLGCGTGLVADEIREYCEHLTGYDISANMLSEAASKGLYDLLEKRDIGTLEVGEDRYDLIIAADVFIYLGALERVIGWCAGSLASNGRLAFSVELGDAPLTLRESRRFAHSRDYVLGVLRDAGFAEVVAEECVLRQDRGEGVTALCILASGLTVHARDRDEEEGQVV